MTIALIVGLGNPGAKYEGTRHNAGFLLVDEIARLHGGRWQNEKKFFGDACRVNIDGFDVRLLKPDTFMNRSGQSVQAMAQFFKLTPAQLIVAHDELDISPGELRLKQAGGHGGHNGLRDISAKLGADYLRFRVGIGHPGHRDLVSGFVLSKPSLSDAQSIEQAVRKAADAVPALLRDGPQRAMNNINRPAKKAAAAVKKSSVAHGKKAENERVDQVGEDIKPGSTAKPAIAVSREQRNDAIKNSMAEQLASLIKKR